MPMMSRRSILKCCALAILATGIAAAKDEKAWLDGRVIEMGHVAGQGGHQVSTATVVIYDPGNASPLARKQVWVITADAYIAKTVVPLSVGTSFKAYRTGETSQILGFIVVRYLDKKGREKGDDHLIIDNLSAENVP
jgi:hypothetical protein